MVSPGPSVRTRRTGKGRPRRFSQPADIREGVANAYLVVKEVGRIRSQKNMSCSIIKKNSLINFFLSSGTRRNCRNHRSHRQRGARTKRSHRRSRRRPASNPAYGGQTHHPRHRGHQQRDRRDAEPAGARRKERSRRKVEKTRLVKLT